ncbi:hypothetical protein [Actinomadura fibrosa]|uniref:Lipoprotein n=1 Tax=Actinomadura fibrosa TaxID=111802 RepID=A0ABW2XJI6_9ACTN|nr:hypothetical protein [Actinomadura fibrosa]
MIIAGVAAAAVVAVGVTAAVAFTGGGSEAKKPKPTAAATSAWSREVRRVLASSPGLRYDGTMSVDGKPVQARLRVTRAGSASGTLTAGALKADVVAVDDVTYIKAGTAFWRDYVGETAHPENFAGRWSKAPAALPGFDVPDVLGPASIAARLAKAAADPSAEDVNGVRALKVRTRGADYLVSAAAPYRLLAVRTAGRGDPRFTVTEIPDAAPLFAEIRPRVAALGGAADPALHFTPGKLTFVNCDQNTNGCTVSVPATLASPEGAVPAGARAALRASIDTRGRPLGSCAASSPVPSDRSLTLRCTVQGRAWRTWMKAALDQPGAHPYEARARVVGEAVAAAEVPGLLAAIDKERAASRRAPGASATPSAGARTTPAAGGRTRAPAAKRSTAPAKP